MYDQIAFSYLDQHITISISARNYYWLQIKDTVFHYIQHCHTCKCAKIHKNQYNSILKPLSISICLWTDFTLYFVIKHLSGNNYTTVFIVIDRLTKKRYYIQCTKVQNSITVEATLYLLLNNVWKFHSLLLSLISD